MSLIIRLYERVSGELGPEREKNDEGIRVVGRLSRMMDHVIAVPLPVPMVFLVRNYVRAAQILPLDWD